MYSLKCQLMGHEDVDYLDTVYNICLSCGDVGAKHRPPGVYVDLSGAASLAEAIFTVGLNVEEAADALRNAMIRVFTDPDTLTAKIEVQKR